MNFALYMTKPISQTRPFAGVCLIGERAVEPRWRIRAS